MLLNHLAHLDMVEQLTPPTNYIKGGNTKNNLLANNVLSILFFQSIYVKDYLMKAFAVYRYNSVTHCLIQQHEDIVCIWGARYIGYCTNKVLHFWPVKCMVFPRKVCSNLSAS